jgi:aspartyl protease family protein
MRLGLSLALILGTIALLVLMPGQGSIAGLERDTIAGVTISIGCAILIGGWMLRDYRGRLPDAVQALAIWLIIILALVAGYSYRFELQAVANRVLGSLVPGLAIGEAAGETVITRSGAGTFAVDGLVNGRRARFIFDTGASTVVIRQEEAGGFGIATAGLAFDVSVSTANGRTFAAPVRLESVAVGPIVVRDVRALVARAGTLGANLLGHSFLSRLGSYTVEGDRLILRGR